MQTFGNGSPFFTGRSTFDKEDEARRDVAAEMFCVYNGFHDETLTAVQTRLRKYAQDPSFDLTKKPFVPVNITQRLMKDLAMIYKQPATRRLLAGVDANKKPVANPQFDALMAESNIRKAAKLWNVYANLFNTVLVRPVWRPSETSKEKGALDFLVYTPNHTAVLTDPEDYTRAIEVRYWVTPLNDGGDYETEIVVWTKDEHYKATKDGRVSADGSDDGEMVNPYPELPFAVLRLQDVGEFWGPGAQDLVEAHLVINGLIALLNDTGVMQGFEDVWFLNMADRKPGMDPESKAVVHSSGPGKRHAIETGSEDEGKPEILTYTPSLMLDELTRQVDWLCRLLTWRYGLSADRVAAIVSSQRVEKSGVAKLLDNADLEEVREDQVDAFREFEADLFRKVRMVLKVDANIDLPEGEFRVDFAEMAVKVTEDERRSDREFRLANNMTDVPTLMRQDNPDLSEVEAEKLWRQHMARNQEADGYGSATRRALREDDGTPRGDDSGAE